MSQAKYNCHSSLWSKACCPQETKTQGAKIITQVHTTEVEKAEMELKSPPQCLFFPDQAGLEG